MIIGGTAGLVVAVAYAATAGWLCSGIRACPASWEPFALVSSIIFVVITVAGIVVSLVGAKLYKIFDTALVIDDDGEGGDAASSERPEPAGQVEWRGHGF